MAKYRVRGPDGAVHVFEGPDGASPADIEAAAAQQFGASSAPAAAPAAQPEERSMLANIASGLASGVADLGDTIINAGTKLAPARPEGMLFDRLPGKEQSLQQNADRNASLEQFNADHGDSTAFKLARVGGNIAATAPVGGALGAGVKALSAAPIVQALGNAAASGGLRTGAAMGGVSNMAVRAAGGALNGGVSTALVDPDQALSGAAFGAALPGVVGVLGKAGDAARGVARAGKAAVEPFTASGQQAIAGRLLEQAAGENASAVAARLGSASPVIPGSLPTAAQVADSGGLAALERAVAAANPEPFAKRAMDQAAARVDALRGIAQDAPARASAVAARKAAADPLYAQATQANYTVTPALQRLLETPAMAQALERAKKLAENNQRAFTFNVTPPSPFSGLGVKGPAATTQITGQGLQDLKMAVDDMLKDPTSGFQGSAGDAVRGLRGKLVNFMEGSNPAFKAARTTYADMSKPISQMDVGSALYEKLRPALADYGNVSRETGNTYATALRNADKTARDATNFKGAGMADTMTPEQMESLGAIAKDLARKVNAQDLGRGPGSDTAQKLAFQNLVGNNIAEQSGYPRLVRALPAAVGAVAGAAMGGGVGAGAGGLIGAGVGKGAQALYSGQNAQIQSLIAQALLDPGMAAGLMRSAAPAGQAAVGGPLRQAITSDQAKMLADLFARSAPVALSAR